MIYMVYALIYYVHGVIKNLFRVEKEIFHMVV